MVRLVDFCRRHIADSFNQSAVLEPIDPFEGGELDRFEVTPGAALTDHLGLVQADDGVSQGIVVEIPDAAHRRFDPGLSQTLAIANRQVLAATVAVMNQIALVTQLVVIERLITRVQSELDSETRQPTIPRA